MTTPQSRVTRAGLAQLPGPAASTPPGGGGRGQAAGAAVPAAWPQTGAGPVGQGDGAGPAPPPVHPPCTCSHPQVVHDLARDNRTRTKCLTFTGPKGTQCGCKRYEPEVPDGDR